MERTRCVVFDVDDTLYLERDYVRSGFQSVGEWVGLNLGVLDFSSRAWDAFESGLRGSIFDVTLQRCGIDPTPEIVGALVDLYRRHPPGIELCPDARICLESSGGRFALATVTDGPIESQRAKVDALGLARWVGLMVFTAELGAEFGKPSPRGFEIVEQATGCSGAQCVYVADNPIKDFDGPRSLGWRTVRVRRAAGLHCARVSTSAVDLEVPDLREGADLFERLWAADPAR